MDTEITRNYSVSLPMLDEPWRLIWRNPLEGSPYPWTYSVLHTRDSMYYGLPDDHFFKLNIAGRSYVLSKEYGVVKAKIGIHRSPSPLFS